MSFPSKTRAAWRASAAAALIGSGLGLGLGAVYMAAGLGAAATEHARASQPEIIYADLTAPTAEGQPAVAADAVARAPVRLHADLPQARGKDLDCLTAAVYYEARGESPSGQAAVAQVVLNRVRHPAFPKSVCGVVYQGAKGQMGGKGCQFSFACNGAQHANREPAAWKRARRVAISAMAGAQLSQVGAATHFHTTGVAPKWGPQMIRVGQVGLHVFYRLVPGRARSEPQRAVFASFAPTHKPGPEAAPEPAMRLSVAMAEALAPEPAATVSPADAMAEAPAPTEAPPVAEPASSRTAVEPAISPLTPVS